MNELQLERVLHLLVGLSAVWREAGDDQWRVVSGGGIRVYRVTGVDETDESGQFMVTMLLHEPGTGLTVASRATFKSGSDSAGLSVWDELNLYFEPVYKEYERLQAALPAGSKSPPPGRQGEG